MLRAMVGRLAAVDARARRHAGDARTDDVESLRAELNWLKRELEIERNRSLLADDRARDWQRRFGMVGDQPCGTCGEPLRFRLRKKRFESDVWEHRDPAHEAACLLRRRSGGWDPGPLPAEELSTAS